MKDSTKQKMRRIISMMTYPLLGLVGCFAVWFSFTFGTESTNGNVATKNGAKKVSQIKVHLKDGYTVMLH